MFPLARRVWMHVYGFFFGGGGLIPAKILNTLLFLPDYRKMMADAKFDSHDNGSHFKESTSINKKGGMHIFGKRVKSWKLD